MSTTGLEYSKINTNSFEKEILKSVEARGYKHEQQDENKQKFDSKGERDDEELKHSKKLKKKHKSRKYKNGETGKQNICVAASLKKFEALEEKNSIHNTEGQQLKNCQLCEKPVFKMEEVKAERNIYHKNCFRCKECCKKLQVDNYHSHEGIVYCNLHFKLLFAPKHKEIDTKVQTRIPEPVIRENQPMELSPDVIRACDKPDLGLDELQQINFRSRVQVFEGGEVNNSNDLQDSSRNSNNTVIRGNATILTKVAKLEQLCSNVGKHQQSHLDSEAEEGDEIIKDSTNEDASAKLIREQNSELSANSGETVNDIRNIFEKGHRERQLQQHEERKQEIQNIRYRLFMGKQARIKEIYQQAVSDSDCAPEKRQNIAIKVDSKSLRERFENGDAYRENQSRNENDGKNMRKPTIGEEADVFDNAISKESRSIFMKLDANLVNGKNQNLLFSNSLPHQKPISSSSVNNLLKLELDDNIVKSGEPEEELKIITAEVSEKFKFFEKYHLTQNESRIFRITPPRGAVTELSSSDANENMKELSPVRNIVANSRTTSLMLDKFRELEKHLNRNNNNPKPLKCFTPPPDGCNRLVSGLDSDECDSSDDDENESNSEEHENDNMEYSRLRKDDEALEQAKSAARTKLIRIKFEEWRANEIKPKKRFEFADELNNASEKERIESAQSIRKRFEQMRGTEKRPQSSHPRYQVNRFV